MTSLVSLFQDQVRQRPDHPALLGALSYSALDAASDRAARQLIARGAAPGDVVALALPRSADLLIAILGTLKAGCSFFPLGTKLPAARLASLLRTSAARLLVTEEERGLAPGICPTLPAALLTAGANAVALPSLDDDPARPVCLFHTSGTTGHPKVMPVFARGILRIALVPDYIRLGTDARIAHMANPAFDALSFEVWGALLNGATLVGFSDEEMLDLDRAAERLRVTEVTDAFMTTAYFNLLASEKPGVLRGLRQVLFGGEQANPAILHRLCADHPGMSCRISNIYGPTECTTFALAHPIDPSVWARADHPATIPVGQPLRETCAVITRDGAPAADGEWGEIWLGGAGLTSGYLGQPEETAARFVTPDWADGERYYRTGDLGRQTAAGIECGGRLDHQVKLRGHRIELPEIETRLMAEPGVRQAVVLVRDGQIVAHVAGEPAPEPARLAAALADSLPAYMLPQRYDIRPRLPLTPNGKADRAALALTPLPPAGRTFAEMGGDSLSAARLVQRLRAEGVEVTVAELLSGAPLADLLARAPTAPAPAEQPTDAPLLSYPAAAEQRRLWLLQQMRPASTAYSIPLRFDFEDPIDRPAMEAALTRLFAHHAALRSAFAEAPDGRLMITITPPRPIPLTEVSDPDAFFALPFDLAEGPLLRAALSGQSLLLNLHHAVVDGASLNLLLADLARLYRGQDPAPAGDYSGYPRLQDATFASPAYRTRRQSRAAHLAAFPAPEADPLYAPDQPTGRLCHFSLPRPLLDRLKTLAARRNETLFPLLLGAVALAEWRMGLGSNLSIGVPVGLRPDGFDRTVGMFVNSQACRFSIDPATPISDWLDAVARETAAMLASHDVAYDHMLEDRRATGSYGGLFDTMFVLENTDHRLPGLKARFRHPERTVPRFPLTLFATVTDEGLVCQIEHDLTRHDAAFAARLAARFTEALTAIADGAGRIADLSPLPDPLARLALHAQDRPDFPAVRQGRRTMSFAALDRAADAIAARLLAEGQGQGALVGIALRPTPEMVASVFGILRAGAAYVPLDPAYPAARLAGMIEDARLTHVISDGSAPLPAGVTAVSPVGADQTLPAAVPQGDLAYVIFTSGSTGRPKGVPIRRACLAHYLSHVETAYLGATGLTGGVVSTSLSFDATVTSLFGPLLAGLPVILPDGDGTDTMIAALAREALGLEPRLFKLTPSHLAALIAYAGGATGPAAHLFVVGGEQLPAPLVSQALARFPAAQIVNEYGPTETTVGCATAWARAGALPQAEGAMLIGRAIAGMRLTLRRADGSLAGPDEEAEIFIGGAGLSSGYLHRPDLTADRFLPDPAGGLHYRTGDRARRLASGDLLFLGRTDDQIKLNGFRIEPGEIEAALRACPGVTGAAVLAEGETLVAHVTPETLDPGKVAAAVAEVLPAHLRPARILPRARLPLSPAGKLDRAQLRSTGPGAPPSPRAMSGHPGDRLMAVFAEVLGHPVAPGQHFFDAGAGSLALMKVHARLKTELPGLQLVDFFTYPTIADLAAHLSATGPVLPTSAAVATPLGTSSDTAADRRVAIIGMAASVPGASDLGAFWDLIRSGREAIRHGASRGADHVNAVAMLDRPLGFDPAFFGLTDRDAALMDPQQRHLLMGAVQALDHAGLSPGRQPRIGLALSSSENTYHRALLRAGEAAGASDYGLAVVHEKDFLATRIAHLLGLEGPALTVQTACSGSLVAVHQACRMLLADEADACLAGGVALDIATADGYRHQPGHIFSADGHCAPFSDRAQGTVPANGWGIVVLKRLDRAMADGDRILAVIEASAVNNDGNRKVGFTAPSVAGQRGVIAAALAQAGRRPAEVGYVEAHGTATELGDPIEVEALSSVYGQEPVGAVALGSVKSQIGHLGAGAGIAGLIRTVLSLLNSSLPPTFGFDRAHPALDFNRLPFRVLTRAEPWPDARPLAAVSSFGMGGTNAHLLLSPAATESQAAPHGKLVFPFAAHSESALRARLASVADRLAAGADPAALAAALARGLDDRLPVRAAVAATGAEEAVAGLDTARAHRPTGWSGSAPAGADALAKAWCEGLPAAALPQTPGTRPAWDLPPYGFDLTDHLHPALARQVAGDAAPVRRPLEDWLLQPVWQRIGMRHAPADAAVWLTDDRQLQDLSPGAHVGLDLSAASDPVSQALALLRGHGGRLRDLGAHVTFFTSGSFGPEGMTEPAAALVAALARVAAAELPGLRLRLIDGSDRDTLPPAGPERPFDWLALRAGRLFRRDLAPVGTATTAPPLPNGTYLITGGSGGIAAAMTEALLADPANRVILLSRSGRGPVHPRVTLWQGDVTDGRRMAAHAETLRLSGIRLAGAIHAAGLPGGGALALLSDRALAATLAPKRDGARLILDHFAPLTEEFVLFCSSLSAETGIAGQADYAATNAWLDALAEGATGPGPRILSLSWPAWQGVGMAAQVRASGGRMAALAERLDAMAISAGEGMEVLRRALSLGRPHLVVSPLPHETVLRFDAPEMPPARGTDNGDLATLFASLLGRSEVDPDASFFDLGGDSLLALDLFDAVAKATGQRPPARLLSGRLSLSDLTAALEAPEGPAKSGAQPVTLRPGTAPPLVFLHPIGGDLPAYRALIAALPEGPAILGVEDPALTDPGAPEESLTGKARAYLAALPPGPLRLAGWSFGGLLAYEMARLAPGRILDLTLIDPPLPRTRKAEAETEAAFLSELDERRAGRIGGRIGGERDGARGQPYLYKVAAVWKRNARALAAYEPAGPVELPARLWLARDQGLLDERTADWRGLLPRVRTERLEADHFAILEGQQAARIAAALATPPSRSTAVAPQPEETPAE
ncbi:non-ribosomal peptide synthetase [Frigidibacter sp. SD6-1]|uniref:non-ribosomal peptide synthetase n=1 Tax=Frigidibacter sp. SD6-1 TaxID=3032581 RepID=UPI0024DFBDA6|nr:non-ribosomal peptide synthetase [Frigidibacter sp. SD6-1]